MLEPQTPKVEDVNSGEGGLGWGLAASGVNSGEWGFRQNRLRAKALSVLQSEAHCAKVEVKAARRSAATARAEAEAAKAEAASAKAALAEALLELGDARQENLDLLRRLPSPSPPSYHE